MGNCTASKLGGGEQEDAVSLCRERKRLLKAAVEGRHALAGAHERYIHSLHAVAGAINLFVARHSSPSPLLTTFPSSSDPSFLRQTPTEPRTEALGYRSSVSSSSSSALTSSVREEKVGLEGIEEAREMGREMDCGYFFTEPPYPPYPPPVFGWDFFNPFEGVRAAEATTVMVDGFCRSSDEVLRAMREREGIPELEEEGQEEKRELTGRKKEEKVALAAKFEEGEGGKGMERGLTVFELPEKKMELLDALKDVEEEFLKAYESGKELGRMLEANRIHIQHGYDESKENSSKFIQAITWHRSFSSVSSSSKSYLASSSKDSFSTVRSEIFEDYGGMGSGSHSQTLCRLYAWEKKLYEEVKTGERTRQLYEKKCLQLRNQDAKGSGSRVIDKTRTCVKDLYARILVALRTIEMISIRIEKVQDEELQPQLIELLQGLRRTWTMMLGSHERQKQIMFEVKAFTCPSYGRYCSESQRQVTKKLEEQIANWRVCFKDYAAVQRSYVDALYGWLSKFFSPHVNYYSKSRSSAQFYREGSPPLLSILQQWSNLSKKLPDRAVCVAMKGFVNYLLIMFAKQENEQQQKRKVDGLAKEYDQKVATLQKAENRFLESKLSDLKPEPEVLDRVQYLSGRRDQVDLSREKLEAEKARHQKCMQETSEATLNGFRIGMAMVFESMADFSRDSGDLYSKLLGLIEKGEVGEDVEKNPNSIEDSDMEVSSR